MESLSFSHSIVNNLNQAFDIHSKINQHLQTGKKIMHSTDDVGEASKLAKLNSSLKIDSVRKQNLQNALSFVQTQDGVMSVVGKILTRTSELKVRFESVVSNAGEKANYDEEFSEIQRELRHLGTSKWNGVSLFSVSPTEVLFGTSKTEDDISAPSTIDTGTITLKRSGIFDNFRITKAPEAQIATSSSGGQSQENRTVINLLGPSGEITWNQNPYSVTDYFRAVHGSEELHAAVYGTGANIELYDSPDVATRGKRTLGRTGPSQSGMRTDVFEFGRNGNSSPTLELIVNEFGQTSRGTAWAANYAISYDPYPVNMVDKTKVWSLADFELSDFTNFEKVLVDARAQNGAEQKRISGEIYNLDAKQMNLEKSVEASDGLDFAMAMGLLNKSRNQMQLNANLVSAAKEMENVLFTDFLEK